MELGNCPEQFSRFTPRMLFATMAAGRRRLRREYNERLELAYQIVRLTRTPKPPRLRDLLISLEEPEDVRPVWVAQRDVERRALAMIKKRKR